MIGGSRVWPDLAFDSAGNDIGLQAIRDIEPETAVSAARFQALCDSTIARSLRHAVVSSDKPLDLHDLIGTVSEQLQVAAPSNSSRRCSTGSTP